MSVCDSTYVRYRKQPNSQSLKQETMFAKREYRKRSYCLMRTALLFGMMQKSANGLGDSRTTEEMYIMLLNYIPGIVKVANFMPHTVCCNF